MIKRITLINPPYSETENTVTTISVPMGISSIAAVLEKEGYDVNVIDASVDGTPLEEIVEDVKSRKPDLIGLSCIFVSYHQAIVKLAIMLKEELDVPVILGGNHATALAHHFIEKEGIDFVGKGEGEALLPPFIEALNTNSDLKNIEGLVYIEDGKVIDTGPGPILKDLDDLPMPAYHLFDMKKYKSFELMYSRGCPFKCTFCASQVVFTRKVRYKPIEHTIGELRYLVDNFGNLPTVFYDDTYTLREKHVMKLLDRMLEEKFDLKWRCATRVSVIKTSMLNKMKEAGCDQIKFGIESGNDEMLLKLRKAIKVSEVREAVYLTKKAGIMCSTFFMIGNIGESKESVFDSFRLIKDIRPSTASFAIAIPLPGTEMANELEETGLITQEELDWNHLLPMRMITRDYEPYAAELAARRGSLTPEEIMKYGKIGNYLVNVALIYSPKEILFRMKADGFIKTLGELGKVVISAITNFSFFIKTSKLYFGLEKLPEFEEKKQGGSANPPGKKIDKKETVNETVNS
ncbi:MAG: radical SAM protein [bacterium]|nr:radical SAM protein [bacterium]